MGSGGARGCGCVSPRGLSGAAFIPTMRFFVGKGCVGPADQLQLRYFESTVVYR